MTQTTTTGVHYLTVAEKWWTFDREESADRKYTIECPGVTDACRAWRPCSHDWCPSRSDDHRLWADPIAHGVAHRFIRATWMIGTGQCYLLTATELPRVADDLADRKELSAGRYPVVHAFGDGDLVDLDLIDSWRVSRDNTRC